MKNATIGQQSALGRHGLSIHSRRSGWIIAKAHDGWVTISPEGNTEFHIASLELAKAEIDFS